jgi:hypothetical protein
MTSQGRDTRRQFTHVAVQVDPNQAGVVDPDRVHAFLSGYFDQEKITIFPGTVSNFIDELVTRWKAAYGEDLEQPKRARRLQ